MTCNIYDCPQNNGTDCQLSLLGKQDDRHMEPSSCQHRKYKTRGDKDERKSH